jgi:hypothetical protein
LNKAGHGTENIQSMTQDFERMREETYKWKTREIVI